MTWAMGSIFKLQSSLLYLLALVFCSPAICAESVKSVTTTADLATRTEAIKNASADPGSAVGQMALGLMFILGLIFAFSWLMKRLKLVQFTQGSQIKLIATQPLGTKEKLAVVQVGEKQWLIGITSQNISMLSELDEKIGGTQTTANFGNQLQKLMNLKQGVKS